MISKERKKQIYMDARVATGCSQNDWARLYTLSQIGQAKHRQKGQPVVYQKENDKKGVNLPECLAAELLRFMYSQGYDVKNIQFGEDGGLLSVPKLESGS